MADVGFQNAYRFEGRVGGEFEYVEGFVFKVSKLWEARVEGTAIVAQGETRKEAVELALRQLKPTR